MAQDESCEENESYEENKEDSDDLEENIDENESDDEDGEDDEDEVTEGSDENRIDENFDSLSNLLLTKKILLSNLSFEIIYTRKRSL